MAEPMIDIKLVDPIDRLNALETFLYHYLSTLNPKSVLSLGSGTSEDDPILNRLFGSKVIGVDFKQGLVDEARSHNREVYCCNVDEIKRIPEITNSEFDLIMARNVWDPSQEAWSNSLDYAANISSRGFFTFATLKEYNCFKAAIRNKPYETTLDERSVIEVPHSKTCAYDCSIRDARVILTKMPGRFN